MKIEFKIQLAALDRKDIETIRQWRNDYQIMRSCRQTDFISDAEQEHWFDRQSSDPSIRMYRVETTIDGTREIVGVAGLTSIDSVARRAEFSLYIAPKVQRRGFGRAALIMLLSHGFQNLNLHQIWGECFDGNPALALFKSLGMSEDGRRRGFYFKDGRYIDAILVSTLAEEWRAFLGNRGVLPVDASGSDRQQCIGGARDGADPNGAPSAA